jgi:deazaflavin-dependent oxidoreductase (nitroreductase family)
MAKAYRLGPARRAVNGLFTALIQAGIGGRANYLLTTTGRKTGRKRTTPVTLIEDLGERWLVSPYGNVGWVYNVRARPEVSLSRANRSESLRAEEAGPEVAGPILKQYLCSVPVTAPFFDAKFTDPVERFAHEAVPAPGVPAGQLRRASAGPRPGGPGTAPAGT